MSGKAPVSVCFIVRDDEGSGLLDECFQSVRPHVAEIVVVDTGSTDGTPDIARRYADVFEVFTDCNDPETGKIADFAAARNRSFDLATQPWVMWMDSDDVLRGGEHLAKLIAVANANRGDRDWCYLFPYEYVYSPSGQCTCLHYRERLVSRRSAMRWVNPVHEVMIPEPGAHLALVPCEDVVFQHQRQRSKKPQEGGRNLRILQKLVEVDGSKDARQFYYLGLEYANAGNLAKATEWLSRYVSVSGWDDEKTMAALKLADIAYAQGHNQEGIVWAFRAVETREGWGEGYFALARGFYNLALKGPAGGDVRRNWEKCAHFARMGLSLPPTKTMLFVNPLERALDVHVYLTMALSQLGDAKGALKHAEEAFKVTPTDPNLIYNKRTFERLVAKDEAKIALDKLVAAEGLDAPSRDQIMSVLNGDTTSAADGWPRYERPAGYPKNVEERHFPVAKKTPHARAWGIPEACELDDLPVRMTDAQVEAATILLWKEYVLHDEILAAEQLLANAPYRARHSRIIEEALARTRQMTAWMHSHDEQQKWNSPPDTAVETGVALPDPLTGQVLDRSNLGIAAIKPGEKVLDFGCFDGGITNRWGLAGVDVTGVDLCETSIALANRKAEEFQTGAKHVCSKFSELNLPEKFDVVTCCDTYEHVKEHVKDIIAPARRALKPNGRMVLTTPHGAWMRGEFIKWAHPWRWADEENRPWNTDLPHAHLIAPTPWSVAGHFHDDGWWVKDSHVIESASHQDVPGQGNVYAEAWLEPPKCDGERLDIIFACGDAWQAWNPLVHRTKGIGGSETMVVEMAKRLSLAGHRVRVYTSTGKYGEGVFDGVEYRQSAMLDLAGECDVLIAWRNAAMLNAPVKAKARLLWVHDIWAHNVTHRNALRADRVLALSEWHRQFLIGHHNLPAEQVVKTRNGIDLTRFDAEGIERDPHRVVYSSSPDRALPVLLQVWPEIRQRVPDAKLDIFYGFFNWKKIAQASGDQAQLRAIAQLEARIAQLGPHGVTMRGKVDQKTLAREFMASGVWASPTWFSETSCITAMEAQAAGLRIVTSSIAALNETVGPEYGVLIDGDWLSPEYQDRFVDETVRALTAPEGEWLKTRDELKARARRDFGLDALAEDWVRMMRELIESLKVSPLVPYRQRADFTREAA